VVVWEWSFLEAFQPLGRELPPILEKKLEDRRPGSASSGEHQHLYDLARLSVKFPNASSTHEPPIFRRV
jgi:hypothetical protein